jgi:hypothetical protein
MLIYIPLMFLTGLVLFGIRISRNPTNDMEDYLQALFLSYSITSIFFFQILTPFTLVYLLMNNVVISDDLLKSILWPTIYGGTICLVVVLILWYQKK